MIAAATSMFSGGLLKLILSRFLLGLSRMAKSRPIFVAPTRCWEYSRFEIGQRTKQIKKAVWNDNSDLLPLFHNLAGFSVEPHVSEGVGARDQLRTISPWSRQRAQSSNCDERSRL
jgi:hypothetical protein